MKNFDQVFLKSTLQILHVQQTATPGILKLWVRLPTNLMYPINLKINRRFYINSRVIQPSATEVSKILPRQKASNKFHLYEIEQDEENFQNKLDDLMNDHLSNADIDGVYETQVPLDYRVILDLGSVIRPIYKNINTSESALNRIYNLNELATVKIDSFRNPFKNNINKVLLYHSSSQQKHFIGVYIPDQKQFMLIT